MTEHTISLPDWMRPHPASDGTERPGWFLIDPDGAYTEWLGLLGIDAPDQYDMEVAQHCIRLDCQLKARMFGLVPEGHGALHFTIRGTDGYKERWAVKSKPVGKLADVQQQHGEQALRRIGLAARERFRAIRGTLPG